MSIKELDKFRIVGGTSLSLQLGHRESVDIDLFTDAEYGSIDFNKIDEILNQNFAYVESFTTTEIGMGKSYFIGQDENNLLKLDLFYTDLFVFPGLEIEHIRFAAIEEIIAMKFEVIAQGGRKKDFWDIHELLEYYSLNEMINCYFKRYPYNADKDLLLKKIIDFDIADSEFTPICYRGKYWELIKQDFEDLLR
ncbi:nucleotidyl transferase AbiEii/AbiGii toxin family protein [Lutibacter sp. HS1-25]|uniref:nucleotidyl transferase AbiEii/AbiGii toxin family protein n=1 Tax=Lutibacter sp. HS1-25 TaxID=2485000 RepID=UPI001F0C7076|nr:nucleotidyl transferase AbiEii/AbiGii toxin family protein [Lutibacter sp. HS1-25]